MAESDTTEQAEVGTLALLQDIPGGDRAGIESQVATAKRYPRKLKAVLEEIQQLVTRDEETAGSMFYNLPARRGQGDDGGKKKDIEGPSARFAEVVLFGWGNARAEAVVVGDDGRFVTAVGTFFDLERNVAVRFTVRRRITTKHGKRYGEDMIGVTGQAAAAIAFRNVILKGIPKSMWETAYKHARLASTGKGTLEQKRTVMLDWFIRQGATADQVYRLLEVEKLEGIGVDEMIRIRGIANAIKEGETTIEQVFNPEPPASEEASKLDEALAGKPLEKPAAAPETPPRPEPPSWPRPLDTEALATIAEAYRKAGEKATELATLGKLEFTESEQLDDARDRGDLDALIGMDVEFGKRLRKAKK